MIRNHLHKLLVACEPSAVVPFSFQDISKALHGSVINALSNSGYALLHICNFQIVIEYPIRILEASVTVEQRMGIGVRRYGSIQGVKYQRMHLSFCVLSAYTGRWDKKRPTRRLGNSHLCNLLSHMAAGYGIERGDD